MTDETVIDGVDVSVYTIPTELPEADGTLAWESTTVVVVEPHTRSGVTGLGYAFGDTATGALVRDRLVERVVGVDVHDTGVAWERMRTSIRNLGRPGICSMAIAAVDIALWDTKARCLGAPCTGCSDRSVTPSPSTGAEGSRPTPTRSSSPSSPAGSSRGSRG